MVTTRTTCSKQSQPVHFAVTVYLVVSLLFTRNSGYTVMRNKTNRCMYWYVDVLWHKQRGLLHVSASYCSIFREVFFEGYITKNIKTIKCNIYNKSFTERLPEDGHNRWPKRVAVHTTINLRICICTCWSCFWCWIDHCMAVDHLKIKKKKLLSLNGSTLCSVWGRKWTSICHVKSVRQIIAVNLG